jgi:hypothetical protein
MQKLLNKKSVLPVIFIDIGDPSRQKTMSAKEACKVRAALRNTMREWGRPMAGH